MFGRKKALNEIWGNMLKLKEEIKNIQEAIPAQMSKALHEHYRQIQGITDRHEAEHADAPFIVKESGKTRYFGERRRLPRYFYSARAALREAMKHGDDIHYRHKDLGAIVRSTEPSDGEVQEKEVKALEASVDKGA